MSDTVAYNSLLAITPQKWKGNRSLHLPVAGAARPWLCRGFERPLLIVLPDSRQARNFFADANSIRPLPELSGLPNVELMPEIAIASFADDPQMLEAQKAERGEAMSRWVDEGGVLLATPGALMGPISFGGDRLELVKGEEISRTRLIDWLQAKGYERVDIVWSPGQYTYRGGIVDLFDPKDSYPMRVEFFDDEIESMRFFATDTQRSVRNFSRGEARALSSRKNARIGDFFPPDMHVVFVEPPELENAADSYAWLRAGVERELAHDEPMTWLDIERALSLSPRVRLVASVARGENETGIMGLPNFRGRRRDLESYCGDLKSRGISVLIVSETEHFRDWAEKT
ncbi:MAG: hypothetical protein LBQ19_00175, partial [Synergistaceae bacterium]|nr:hypothetical protein [Synergistaceae bacterium]